MLPVLLAAPHGHLNYQQLSIISYLTMFKGQGMDGARAENGWGLGGAQTENKWRMNRGA